MSIFLTLLRFVLTMLVGILTLAVVALVATHFYVAPSLPPLDNLRDIQLQVPLRIYTQKSRLLGEFGEKRRSPVSYEEFPDPLIKAFLAAEDDGFFGHPGVDFASLARAAIQLARTGKKKQGGSTITMQVARNLFLSREKTYMRKLREIFLALRIERELSKEEIITLYLNKIYLGHRSYGVVAAAYSYYGVPLNELTLAQSAMIAGIPKAPSRNNPVSSPVPAKHRRDYILGRMLKLGYIDQAEYDQASLAVDDAQLHVPPTDVEGHYVAEMVRAEMVKRFGKAAYTSGFSVYTTIDANLQVVANVAMRKGLQEYDARHGYRGAEKNVDLEKLPDQDSKLKIISEVPVVVDLVPALITSVKKKSATVLLGDGEQATIPWEGLSWARRYIDHNRRGKKPTSASQVVAVGDLVRLTRGDKKKWKLSQIPALEGALVSLRAEDGAIQALTGGFNFYHSKFNRATQIRRQPGSSFKPIIYSAALENGYSAASIVNDAPVVFDDPGLNNTWKPENYSGKFYGPTRIREALTFSRNMVSIRLLRAIGIGYTIAYAKRFGFTENQLPRNLSLALGSGGIAPLDLATGYAVFANGGYKINPYIISKIVDPNGNIVFEAEPETACRFVEAVENTTATTAPECGPVPASAVITPQNAYLMTSMMRDVINHGTGRKAKVLGRKDLSGKTGTTNDQRDAWFSGFNNEIVTTVWVGFDKVRPLGRNETGGKAALPIWINYMETALQNMPTRSLPEPPGMVTVRIDRKTGWLANTSSKAILETFREENVPEEVSDDPELRGTAQDPGMQEPLF